MDFRPAERTVLLTSPDSDLRGRLRERFAAMHWRVLEAKGGAEAMACLEEYQAEVLFLDKWLPDLDAGELAEMVKDLYPTMDVLRADGQQEKSDLRSTGSQQLLQALQRVEQLSTAARKDSCSGSAKAVSCYSDQRASAEHTKVTDSGIPAERAYLSEVTPPDEDQLVLGIVGSSKAVKELRRMIHLVAPHNARVLIEGETGTGKELVAKALHALSQRAKKAFIVLNCAAIPEALLEAELFGHTRGAFTGAVQSRVGRIEAAHGGTLFLDEIGEMPLALQSKLLRFLENGELQRVGDNETIRVNVRVIAATHQHLDTRVAQGTFRLDLLHRLSVFPIEVPSLRERLEDIPLLADFFLAQLAKEIPKKKLMPDALDALEAHTWPGNVRELGHVLHRAAILAASRSQITSAEIRVRRVARG